MHSYVAADLHIGSPDLACLHLGLRNRITIGPEGGCFKVAKGRFCVVYHLCDTGLEYMHIKFPLAPL